MWSESAWLSLAVKSLRLGWPAGLSRARDEIGKTRIRSLLTCGIFEDVFPTEEDLPAILACIRTHDYPTLCSYGTHHDRGYAEAFCDLEREAVAAAKSPDSRRALWAEATKRKLWLPMRSLNCFYTWLQVRPSRGGFRTVDEHGWAGMPVAVLDGHTQEGKAAGCRMTALSGHYENHRRLGDRVLSEGWEPLRREIHGSTLPETSPSLFARAE